MFIIKKDERLMQIAQGEAEPHPFEEIGGLLDRVYVKLRTWKKGDVVEISCENEHPKEIAYAIKHLEKHGWRARTNLREVDRLESENFLLIS